MTLSELPVVRTQSNLQDLWEVCMGELGFVSRQLFVLLLVDGSIATSPLHITDLPDDPGDGTHALMDTLAQAVGETAEPHCRVAVLLARPGPSGRTAADRRWVTALIDAARVAGVPLWPIHTANDESVRVVTPDDLAA